MLTESEQVQNERRENGSREEGKGSVETVLLTDLTLSLTSANRKNLLSNSISTFPIEQHYPQRVPGLLTLFESSLFPEFFAPQSGSFPCLMN